MKTLKSINIETNLSKQVTLSLFTVRKLFYSIKNYLRDKKKSYV